VILISLTVANTSGNGTSQPQSSAGAFTTGVVGVEFEFVCPWKTGEAATTMDIAKSAGRRVALINEFFLDFEINEFCLKL
jgi:hypothetical protein